MQEIGAQGGADDNPLDATVRLSHCDWLNASACQPTVQLTRSGAGVLVAAYNPLAWSREAAVRVPVDTRATCQWTVLGEPRPGLRSERPRSAAPATAQAVSAAAAPTLRSAHVGPEGQAVDAQLVWVPQSTAELQRHLADTAWLDPGATADAELVFIAELPPLGYNTFTVLPLKGGEQAAGCGGDAPSAADSVGRADEEDMVTIDNGMVQLTFSSKTGGCLCTSASLPSWGA